MKPTRFARLAIFVNFEVADMTEDQRVDFINEIMQGYCRHCGSATLPCYCTRDD